jgi:hypothetical protein
MSQLGIKMSIWLGSWLINNVGMKVNLCLTCLSVCVTEPAVCGNEDRLLWTCLQCYISWISRNQILRNHMGRWGENWRIPRTFPVKYLGNGSSYNIRNSGCWSTPSILTVLFRCFRWRMVERSHPQFPEIRCWANGVQLQGPPNDKFDFLTGNVEEKEWKWRSRNFSFSNEGGSAAPPQS